MKELEALKQSLERLEAGLERRSTVAANICTRLQVLRMQGVKPDLRVAKVPSTTKLDYLLSQPKETRMRYWGGYVGALEVVNGWKVPDAGQHSYTRRGPILTDRSTRRHNTAATENIAMLVTEDGLIASPHHHGISLPLENEVEDTILVDQEDLVPVVTSSDAPLRGLYVNQASYITIDWARVIGHLGELAERV